MYNWNNNLQVTDEDDNVEDKANRDARDFLIDEESFSLIEDINNPTLSEIYLVSESARCSVGVVVARIHYDTKDYTKHWQFLNKFEIDVDMFGNYQ